MFNYYHIYPTCPHCLEPNFKGSLIQEICLNIFCQNCKSCSGKFCQNEVYKDKYDEFDKLYYCNSCGAVFNKYIDMKNFNKTSEIINYDESDIKIPLIWKIDFNDIEKDYLNWIDGLNGKFLITWPWDEVKFIPILIFEYINKYPNSKVVIVDDFYDYDDISKPTAFNLFEHLIYTNETSQFDESLNGEYNKFSFKNIFKKIPKFHYHINIKKNDYGYQPLSDDFSKVCINSTLTEYHRDIIKEIKNDFGNDSIKKDIVEGKERKNYISDNGFINLKFDKQLSWSMKNYRFKNYQLWENICSINKFNRVKNDINYVKIFSNEDLNFDEETQVFFISKEMDNLFDIVGSINPTLVIFPNSDELMKDYSIFYTKLGMDFNNFVKNTFSNCLLFSVNKDIRHLYGFHNDENSFISSNNIQVHTWDSDLILSKLNLDDTIVKTAGSSSFNDIKISKGFDVNCCLVEELNDFEVLIDEIFEETGDKDYKKFLSRMVRSPLLVYSDIDMLNFDMEYSLGLTFEKILINLEDSYPNLHEKLSSVYLNLYKDDENPLIIAFDKIIKDQKSNGFNEVKLVLYNKYELNKFKKVIKYKGINWENVEIIHWNQLEDLENSENTIIISSSYPHITYDLYYSNFKKFIFVGGKSFLNDAQTIIENRIDVKNCRPIHYLDINYPPILNELLSSLNIPKKINKISQEIDEDSPEMIGEPLDETHKSSLRAEVDESVLILINNYGEGLFIPKKSNIMFKHPSKLVDVIDISEKNYNGLKNKEIILNNHKFLVSFKEIFARFLIENGKDMEVISETYRWNNFFELFKSAYDWRDELDNVISIMEKNRTYSLSAEESLAYKLSKSGINAKNSGYIKQFWLSKRRRNIKTSYGILNIYDIEKPQGNLKDLLKIFEVLSEFNPTIDVQKRAFKNFIALKKLLKLRRDFLNQSNVDSNYQHLFVQFWHELELIVKKFEGFKVLDVKKVTLKKSVKLFKKINNFQVYYDE